MIKKLLLLFFLSLGSIAYSQVDFGIKAGLNIARADYNIRDANPEGRPGLFFGSVVDFYLSERFSLQPELSYSREGIRDGSIDFLNIPVALKWYFAEGIHLNAGPQLGIVVDAEGGTTGLNNLNFSGLVGLGYETPGGFMFDTRFVQGITSIIDKDFRIDSGMGYMISGIKAWTQTLQFSIGYKF
ncbi:porin family protein [Salinimicrobium flavum]|uniref:Porin family protein n=1 Tax=Salinimicrobium flavum TaxID=1737065 RepID=A0ABW5IVA5_9FLAO